MDRGLAVGVLATSPLIALVNAHPTGRYLAVITPALAALVWRAMPVHRPRDEAELGKPGADGAGRAWARGVSILMLLVYASMTFAPTLALAWNHRNANYDAWVERVRRHIPEGATVMAHTMFWTGLHDRQFISSITAVQSSVEAAEGHILRFRPEYVVQASHSFAAVGGTNPRPGDLASTAFGKACERIAARVPSVVLEEFYDRDFGAVRVWRFDWSGTAPPTDTASQQEPAP